MSASRPTTGGRFVARRITLTDGCVQYDLALSTPEADWAGVARVELERGGVELELNCLGEKHEAPPDWLAAHVTAALRSAWRGVESPRTAKVDDFPRRLTRWRAPLPGKESSSA
ncbi:MAG: hypothetical protein H6718_08640 [Polyangiaceae bacterium]|nr:hypothetical protein [Myxococcales bacterium]MCB9585451.1 hypothetical protein [Polyangiaceae bacterium]MCB9606533.1 hypothetical protein [Polyangiaceae bacterium]